MVAGVIHLLVTGEHSEIPLYWIFFVALGVLQLAAGLLLIIAGRRSVNVGIISIAMTVSSVILYAISRASLFPSLVESEAIEPIGMFTKIIESAFLIMMSLLLFRSSPTIFQNGFTPSRRTVAHLASLTLIAVLIGQGSFTALGSPFALSSFYGLNLGTKWSYEAGTASLISTPPILANGILYFGTLQVANPPYSLVALNSSTGSLVWQRTTNNLCTCSAPAVYDETLYMVMVNLDSPQESLRAFDARSGVPEWDFTTQGGGYYIEKLQTPQVWGDAVFALLEGDHLYALNSTSGKLLWEYGHEQQHGLAPFAVDRGLVLIGSRYQNYFRALNATSGATVWSVGTDSPFLGQSLAYDGVAYAVSAKGTIYAFDESTGSARWTYTSGVGADEPPVIHDGVLYARGMSGHSTSGSSSGGKITTESFITALDARSGELVWSAHDNGLGMSKVAATEGIVYSGAVYGYGSIYMYDAHHGWFAGVIPMKDKVAWTPAVGDGTLFIATNEGRVYALETSAPNALLP